MSSPGSPNRLWIFWITLKADLDHESFEPNELVIPGHRICAGNESTPALKEGFSSPAQSKGSLRVDFELYESVHPCNLDKSTMRSITYPALKGVLIEPLSLAVSSPRGNNYCSFLWEVCGFGGQIDWDVSQWGFTGFGEWHNCHLDHQSWDSG